MLEGEIIEEDTLSVQEFEEYRRDSIAQQFYKVGLSLYSGEKVTIQVDENGQIVIDTEFKLPEEGKIIKRYTSNDF